MNEFPLKVPLIIIKSRGAIKHHFPVGMRVMAQVKEYITGSYRCIPLEECKLGFQYVNPDCLSLPNYPAGIRARLTRVTTEEENSK